MSINDGFTEDEIAAGIPSFLYYYNDQMETEDNDNQEIQISQLDTYKKNFRISKKIAGFSTNTQIKNYLLKEIFLEYLPAMIKQYQKDENLGNHFIPLAMDECSLILIIKSFYKDHSVSLTDNNMEEINKFVESIYSDKNSIVYDRVSKIQTFLHDIIDREKGEFAHLELRVGMMRNILSTSRLHLNIIDIKNFNIEEILYIFHKTQEEQKKESLFPKAYIPRPKKSSKHTQVGFISNWRYEKMKSLYRYMSPLEYSKFLKLANLDTSQNIEDFQSLATNIMIQAAPADSFGHPAVFHSDSLK